MVEGQSEEGNLNATKKEKGRKAVDEQELLVSSFIELASFGGGGGGEGGGALLR